MRKFVSSLMLLFSIGWSQNCLNFQNSDLDPNSELSLLANLLNLANINRILNTKQYFSIEFEVIPGATASDAGFALASPTPREQSSLARNIEIPPDAKYFRAVPNNQFEVLLEGKNLYRFQLLDEPDEEEDSEIVGTFDLDVFEFSNPRNTPPLRITGDISVNIISIRRLNSSNGIPFSMIFDQRSMGTFGGKSFRAGIAYKLGTLVPGQDLDAYFTILYTEDGINYDTVLIKEHKGSFGSSGQSGLLENTNPILIGGDLFFLARQMIYENGELVETKNYAITLPLNNPQNYSTREIQTQTNPVFASENKTLFAVGNGILYAEADPDESPIELTWRYDLDLLETGSRNFPLDFESGDIFLNNVSKIEQYRDNLIVLNDADTRLFYINENQLITAINQSELVFPSSDTFDIQSAPGPFTQRGISTNNNGIFYGFTSDIQSGLNLGFFGQNLPTTPEPIDLPSIGTFGLPITGTNRYIARSDSNHQFIEFSADPNESSNFTILLRYSGNQGSLLPSIPSFETGDPFLRSMDKSCEVSGDGTGGLWCIQVSFNGQLFSTRLNQAGSWENWQRARPLARFPD